MDNPAFYLTMALTGFAALTMLALVGLKGFSAWLDLKRAELSAGRAEAPTTNVASRIDIADMKERIRKLEAIAAGVEL